MKSIIGFLCMTVVCFSAASCQEQDIYPDSAQSAAHKEGVTITADAELDANSQKIISHAAQGAAATRATLSADRSGNITYSWEAGAEIPLFVYITDGTHHETLTGSVLKVVSEKRGHFQFNVPDKYNLDNLKIAVAIGKENHVDNGAWITKMDTEGNAKIATPAVIDATSHKYNIPLYASLSPLNEDGKSVSITFTMLGSWIGIRAKSDMAYQSNIHSIALESDVLHMDGTLNLSTARPAWIPRNYRIDLEHKEKTDTIRVNGTSIGGSGDRAGTTRYSKPFYVWAKATSGQESRQKARVYVRGKAVSTMGATFKEDKFSMRDKFFSEAKCPIQFIDGDTYYFSVDASLADTDGGLIMTEYYHNTIAIGEYNWIEITNVTNRDISLEDYYLVSYHPETASLYVMALADLAKLNRKNRDMIPDHSTTMVPAGRTICLAASGHAIGIPKVKKSNVYQLVSTGGSAAYMNAVTGGVRYAKFLCKGGWNIDFNDPKCNIVDNFGCRVTYDLATKKYLTFIYYQGPVVFLRSKEDELNVPQKNFLPEVWNWRGLNAAGFSYLGSFNDKDDKMGPLTGYAPGGKEHYFIKLLWTMNDVRYTKFQPEDGDWHTGK